MRTWQSLIVGAAAAALVAGVPVAAYRAFQKAVAARKAAVEHAADTWKLPDAATFTRQETNAFLDVAHRAEGIADPLQRCLAYPDPPRSHWDRSVAAAYCRYRYQPVVTPDEIAHLIRGGHAGELDRRLGDALHARETGPDARGRMNRIYWVNFGGAGFELRALVDAWHRQAPASAYAAAASGWVYANMAFAARGTGRMRDTPGFAQAAMNRLAQQADGDLQRAVRLDPTLMPAYSAIANLGGFSYLGCGYAFAAARRGLAVDPANFGLYDTLAWLVQPKWCGSRFMLQVLWRRAGTHVGENPLLALIAPAGQFKLIDACQCSERRQLAAYLAVLDRAATSRELLEAGDTAEDVNDPQAAAIYLSEALRFDPELDDARARRTYALVEFDRARWAIDEADALLARAADNEDAYKARAWAELQGQNDLPAAQRDFLKAIDLDPTDRWALRQLGGVYAQNGHQWDKAEGVADRLIALDPGKLDGWSLRAWLEQAQRKPELKGTLDEIDRRFGSDARVVSAVARMRAGMLRPAAGATAGKPPSRR